MRNERGVGEGRREKRAEEGEKERDVLRKRSNKVTERRKRVGRVLFLLNSLTVVLSALPPAFPQF